jgi:hypothetical protein
MSSMTARDRAILSLLADWDPPADIVAARESWERHAEELNRHLPVVGAFHEQVRLGPALHADIDRRIAGSGAISSRSLPARRRLGVRRSEGFARSA